MLFYFKDSRLKYLMKIPLTNEQQFYNYFSLICSILSLPCSLYYTYVIVLRRTILFLVAKLL